MTGKHFEVVLSEDELTALADAAVRDLAGRLAHRAFRPLASEPIVRDEPVEDEALARLHVLVHIKRAVARQEDQAARDATVAGAGYPQLGEASCISRQGARQRWPGLVPANKPDHPLTTDRRH